MKQLLRIIHKKSDYILFLKIGLCLILFFRILIEINRIIQYFPAIKKTLVLATTNIPESYSELYFENHNYLPWKIESNQVYGFTFTIHNLENKDMEYAYEVYLDINSIRQNQEQRTVFIKKNQFLSIPINFSIKTPIPRSKMVVNLINKNQQIYFWIE